MEVAGNMDVEDPPQFLLDKVVQAGRNRSRLKHLRHVISAFLTFDSFNLATVGVRGDPAAARQMTFEADDVEIGMWLRPASDQKMVLSGQVLGKSGGPIQDTSAHIDLVVEGDHIASTPLSSWGEFTFSDLPQGTWTIQIYFRDRMVQISPLLG
jgi:hypothetical protein